MFVGGANCRARCEIWPVVSLVRQARFTCNYDLYRGVIFLRGERKIGAMALSLSLPLPHSSTTSAVCARHARRSYTGWNEGPRQIRFLPVKALSLFPLVLLSFRVFRAFPDLAQPLTFPTHVYHLFPFAGAHIIRSCITCVLFCDNWRLPLSPRTPIRNAKSEERYESIALPLGGAYILLEIVRLSKYRFDGINALKAKRICAKSWS